MISNTHTIVLTHESINYKLLKIVNGPDGSLYIMCPYLPIDEVMLYLQTVNYQAKDTQISFDQAIDAGSLTDDSKRLKLSHHASGFIQFSGDGIISGQEPDGSAKGIGIMSYPLENPPAGPAFAITINGFTAFETLTEIESDTHRFSLESVLKTPKLNTLVIEGHCFPAVYRRFIRQYPNGEMYIDAIHPCKMTIPMRVALPPKKAPCQSFLGLELYFDDFGESDSTNPSYVLCSSTGNLRQNDKGQFLGDQLFCIYPKRSPGDVRNLKYIKPNEKKIFTGVSTDAGQIR